MTGHLVLLRHGRTTLNADGRLRGRLDPDLDEVGRAEAERAGRLLARHTVRRIVSSPLARARQTADAVSLATGVSVELDDRLLDRDYGRFAGDTVASVLERFGSLDAAPDVETRADLTDRVVEILGEVAGGSLADDVVLVTHDAVVTILVEHLGPPNPGPVVVPTGSLTDLRRVEGRWVVDAVGVLPAP